MSDDLISRKALLNRFKYSETDNETDKAWICTVRRIIKEMPTSFDKEKVIEELYRYTAEECELHECGIRSEYCNVCIAKKAIEIVEKGGIECI